MIPQHILYFLDRYAAGSYTKEEHAQFIDWLNQASDEDFEQLAEKYRQKVEELPAMPTMNHGAVARMEHLLNEFEQSKNDKQNTPAKIIAFPRRKRTWQRWAVAAAIVLLVSTAYMWFQRSKQFSDRNEIAKQEKAINNDVLPGGDKAILTLADGSTVNLNDAKNGLIGEQGKISILKTADGKLAYNSAGTNSNEVFLNTVTTPNGGTYMLVLSDGTKVWLNAASSLRFPAQFTGRERRVAASGEVYFDVAHDAAHPFIVDVDHTEVHDIGTEFNINSYFDEQNLQTTLVKGAASVKNDNQSVMLEPGKTAVVTGKEIMLREANLAQVTAWKDGNFYFKSMDIESIMRQVSRWYDVTVTYKSKKPSGTYSGIVSRSKRLSEVLKVLEQYDIHCTIDGHTLVVQ